MYVVDVVQCMHFVILYYSFDASSSMCILFFTVLTQDPG